MSLKQCTRQNETLRVLVTAKLLSPTQTLPSCNEFKETQVQTAGEAIGCAALLMSGLSRNLRLTPDKSVKVIGTEMRTAKKMCEICRYSEDM